MAGWLAAFSSGRHDDGGAWLYYTVAREMEIKKNQIRMCRVKVRLNVANRIRRRRIVIDALVDVQIYFHVLFVTAGRENLPSFPL